MENRENAILTVVGKDDVGILAKVATAVAEANASVAQVSQIVMGGFFTMNMHIDVADMNCTIHQLEENIKAVLPSVEVHVMHENIFTSMHSI
jgi:ACT domain-containing protein